MVTKKLDWHKVALEDVPWLYGYEPVWLLYLETWVATHFSSDADTRLWSRNQKCWFVHFTHRAKFQWNRTAALAAIGERGSKRTILDDGKKNNRSWSIYSPFSSLLLWVGGLFTLLGPVGAYNEEDIDRVTNFLKGICIEYRASSSQRGEMLLYWFCSYFVFRQHSSPTTNTTQRWSEIASIDHGG